jgi:hypothetical protein
MNRTILTFPTPANFWPTVDAWAKAKGYRQVAGDNAHRTLQKGIGFLVAPMMVDVSEQDGKVTLQAWVRAGMFVRACALFLIPSEMGIESGGFKMSLPRKIARNGVNDLLAQLPQPPIP